MASHSSMLAWRSPVDRGAWRTTTHGATKSRTQLSDRAHGTELLAAAHPISVFRFVFLDISRNGLITAEYVTVSA